MARDAVTFYLDRIGNDERESATRTFRTTYEEDGTISNSNAFGLHQAESVSSSHFL